MRHLTVGLMAAFAMVFTACSANAQQATINPNVHAQGVPSNQGGGAIVTPSVSVSVPVGPTTVTGSVAQPVYIPRRGSTTTLPPSASIGISIPIGGN